jgi:hypothetical protein
VHQHPFLPRVEETEEAPVAPEAIETGLGIAPGFRQQAVMAGAIGVHRQHFEIPLVWGLARRRGQHATVRVQWMLQKLQRFFSSIDRLELNGRPALPIFR